MRIAATVLFLSAATFAHADPSRLELGGSLELVNGLASSSEVGLALQLLPADHLELEVSAIRHEVDGDPFAGGGDRDTWVLGAAGRGRLSLGHVALLAGIGMMSGEHAARNGCRSSGFLDFCGERNGSLVYRHWRRAMWLRPELAGEVSVGPVAARITVSPLVPLSSPDEERGCLECDDGAQGMMVTLGVHGRIPL